MLSLKGKLTASMTLVASCLLAAGGLNHTQTNSRKGAAKEVRVSSSIGTVVWEKDAEPVLLVHPKPGDGWIHIARRLCGTANAARKLRRANKGLKKPLLGIPVKIPLSLASGKTRAEMAKALFPADHCTEDGNWLHTVMDPFQGSERWSLLALMFCGDRAKAPELAKANGTKPNLPPARRSKVKIPPRLLSPAFGCSQAATSRNQTNTNYSGFEAVKLEYGSDRHGPYAIYRLKKGEALYSAVVVRFTGQLHASEVNRLAKLIAKRSGIKDVRNIPAGYPVKIPLEYLLPQYLPKGDPRRVEWEEKQRRIASSAPPPPVATRLRGVHVILDAGHGGSDTGAVWNGVWESTYAYDLMCRIKRRLEEDTEATVWPIIKDKSRGYTVVERDRLRQDRDQVLLSHPPYNLSDSATGVYLRCYVADSIVRKLLASGIPRSKILFLSVHADSLHPSVRGAMAYIPGASMRPSRFKAKLRSLRTFSEFRKHPVIRIGKRKAQACEAMSRQVASKLLSALGKAGVRVHPYQPLRSSVLRGRRRWVPAVLRYSTAGAAILIESCNLANRNDRKLLTSAKWRERFADAVVKGLVEAYGKEE